MAKRKRPPTPPVAMRSANEERDDRASRRAAQSLRLQAVRDKARRDQLTTLNATKSPLLRLPAELRNIIFAYVYIGTQYSLDDEGFLSLWNIRNPCGLFLVCRQTYAEASLLPYKLGMFDFCTGWQCKLDGLWLLQGFLEKRTPRQIDAMASLKFTQWSLTLNGYWHQTRTAAYWVAKLEDPSVSFYGGFSIEAMTKAVDISSLGPSD